MSHICFRLPEVRQCVVSNYIALLKNTNNQTDLVTKCTADDNFLRCQISCGSTMTRKQLFAGFEGWGGFKIAILRFFTNNPRTDKPSLMNQLDWELEFEMYNRLKRKELAANGTHLYFRAHRHLHFLTSLPTNPALLRPILFSALALQFVYMFCIFPTGRLVLPLAIILINCASLMSACGALSLIGYDAPYYLMEILPCICLSIGADNMIIFVITENCAVPKPQDVATLSYLRSVLWEVVPATRCNNVSLVACSLFAFFSENAHAAAFALHVAVTFSINFILEETCFMAILLLDRRSSPTSSNPFPTCRIPKVLNPNRSYFRHLSKSSYLPLLSARIFQVFIIVVSTALICFSLNLHHFTAIGEDMERFRTHDPDVREFYQFEREHSVLGQPLYFVVTGGLDFSDTYNRKLITINSSGSDNIYNYLEKMGEFPQRSFIIVDKLSSWSDDFMTWVINCCRIKKSDLMYCGPTEKGDNFPSA